MNYQITCVCGHKFLISDGQLSGHVICPACRRALSPVVSPGEPEAAPAVPANVPATTEKKENAVTTTPEEATKRCPFCGEVILAIARKCKHCGEYLDRPAAEALTGGAAAPQGGSPGVPPLPTDDTPVFTLTVSQWDNFWRFTICATIFAVIFVAMVKIDAFKAYALPGILGSLVVLGGIAWFFYASAKRSRCIIRPMRIETVVGILSRDTNTLELFRVTDLELKQGLVERMLGIGTIRVTSNDPNTPELILYEIPQARAVYKYLQQQVPIVARQRGAVYIER